MRLDLIPIGQTFCTDDMNAKSIFGLRLVATIAFGLALGFAIPPVPSDPSSTYSFIPAGPFAAVAFLGARLIEKKFSIAWWQIICEAGFLCLLVYLMLERVQIK
jgi:hypothetical protein